SFDLWEEGSNIGDPGYVGIGLAAGAVTYYAADRVVGRPRRGQRGGGRSLAIGAFLDGIPEQTVLGIGIAAGEGVSVGLLVAIFVSNLPEAIGSATDMRAAGKSRREIRRIWFAVALICAAATVIGYAIAHAASR